MRLLDETGKQIGILNKQDALRMAQTEGKDLVEIAANAKPPVVRLIDFKKFKYLEAKKDRESKKAAKNVGVKEIRLSPFIGDHDYSTRIKQAETFLKEGNQLKISLKFKGRAIIHKEFGFGIVNKAISELAPYAKVGKPPHMEGTMLVSILIPIKAVK